METAAAFRTDLAMIIFKVVYLTMFYFMIGEQFKVMYSTSFV